MPQTQSSAPVNTGPAPGSAEEFMTVVGDRVFYSLDQYNLSPQAQNTLRAQAAWLNRYGNRSIVIEGHADERGTREYNIALGERRAAAARNYLVAQGVAPQRIRVISYGKERPVCGESSEACWAQNRRGVTVLQ
jgi:peptidoglycan-associated lipoprotein